MLIISGGHCFSALYSRSLPERCSALRIKRDPVLPPNLHFSIDYCYKCLLYRFITMEKLWADEIDPQLGVKAVIGCRGNVNGTLPAHQYLREAIVQATADVSSVKVG